MPGVALLMTPSLAARCILMNGSRRCISSSCNRARPSFRLASSLAAFSFRISRLHRQMARSPMRLASSASRRLVRMPISVCCRSSESRRSYARASCRRASSAADSASAAARSVLSPWTSSSCRRALSRSLRSRSSKVTCCFWRCTFSSARDILLGSPPMVLQGRTKRIYILNGGAKTAGAVACCTQLGTRGVVLVGRVGRGVLLEHRRQRAAHRAHLSKVGKKIVSIVSCSMWSMQCSLPPPPLPSPPFYLFTYFLGPPCRRR